MREKDIHEIIEQQNPEAKRQIWEKISAELNLPSSPQPKQEVAVKPKRWKWAAIALAVICVVTLSIVLPLTLKDGGTRFCDITQYEREVLTSTLQEYFSERNSNLLYVDWYDNAEEVTTEYAHITNKPSDVVFYTEFILNGETGEEIILSITDNKTRVDIFDKFYKTDVVESVVDGKVTVRWQIHYNDTLATFEYNGFTYYIELNVGSQERLTEIITDMLK